MILLSFFDLSLAAGLILLLAVSSLWLKFGLEKQLLWASLRTAVQLTLLGLVLKQLFALENPWLVGAISLVMLFAAAKEVVSRQHRRFLGFGSFKIASGSVFISSFTLTFFALVVLLGTEPWWEPKYAIPLLGMMLGNTMSGVALGLNQVSEQAFLQQEKIEGRLALGQTWKQAIREIRVRSIQVGMTPILSSMAVAGVVSLPGMMTGQILAGGDPFEASKYQIMIMFMIATGTGFGVLSAVHLGCAKLFDSRQRLRLDRLK